MAFKVGIEKKPTKSTKSLRVWSQIKYGLQWYCNKTSLHGFHYISNENSSIFTRLFFACVSCCSIIFCTYLIVLQLLDYQNGSIITTVSSTTYPVWMVRFPAVTICNNNVVYKDNIKNMLPKVTKSGINQDIFMDLLLNLSSLIVYDDLDDITGYDKLIDALNKIGYDTDKIMAELAQPCTSMVKKCVWQSVDIPCTDIFRTVKTTQGYCCSFYSFPKTKYTLSGNNNIAESLRYQYVGGAGPTLGLRLFLDVEEAQYVSSVKPSYGLNVLVHDGVDYPDMDLIANTLLTAEELTISVTPSVFTSTASVRNFDYAKRHCLFEDETIHGKWAWSPTYSYETCIHKCKAKAIEQYCGCTPFYYFVGDTGRLCTLLDVPCLQANKYEIEKVHNRLKSAIDCKCYPQCEERIFNAHVDRTIATQMIGYQYSNLSILNVYYNTVGCVKTVKDVYFTWDHVFASIGGIFGLCLGGSVISILECFYFFGKALSNVNAPHQKVAKPYAASDPSNLPRHQWYSTNRCSSITAPSTCNNKY